MEWNLAALTLYSWSKWRRSSRRKKKVVVVMMLIEGEIHLAAVSMSLQIP
jgi:type II secretory pathway pseudopilin PulG